ncbi:hypothetical protein SAMN02745134_01591 [Clostridium acidisoli DSM 12555]|uniref:Uncharacterized protein n=1 Tax=Clostridium acidisoli DSM 12555 TaxID=1121291 RepID=A0A1W1XE80_9CLOT|nr:hypothetical protein SAMN02745134_01591 [Clostridium acidisoli DSM 12555]
MYRAAALSDNPNLCYVPDKYLQVNSNLRLSIINSDLKVKIYQYIMYKVQIVLLKFRRIYENSSILY